MGPVSPWTLADLPDQTGRRWLVTGATLVIPARSAAASDPRQAELVWQLAARETGTDLA